MEAIEKHKQAQATIKDLILTSSIGSLPPLVKFEYPPEEYTAIINELKRYLASKQEAPQYATYYEWLYTFQEMAMPVDEVIMRIRFAKISKRYGTTTEFGDFLGTDINEIKKKYSVHFKHDYNPTYPVNIYFPCNHHARFNSGLIEKLTDGIKCPQCDSGLTFEQVLDIKLGMIEEIKTFDFYNLNKK